MPPRARLLCPNGVRRDAVRRFRMRAVLMDTVHGRLDLLLRKTVKSPTVVSDLGDRGPLLWGASVRRNSRSVRRGDLADGAAPASAPPRSTCGSPSGSAGWRICPTWGSSMARSTSCATPVRTWPKRGAWSPSPTPRRGDLIRSKRGLLLRPWARSDREERDIDRESFALNRRLGHAPTRYR